MVSEVPKRGRSKRGWTQKHTKARNERKNERKRAQMQVCKSPQKERIHWKTFAGLQDLGIYRRLADPELDFALGRWWWIVMRSLFFSKQTNRTPRAGTTILQQLPKYKTE